MKSKSDAENHKKSRLIAEKVYCRDESRQMPNIAICRGKRQLSRFRTHRDKLLPLDKGDKLLDSLRAARDGEYPTMLPMVPRTKFRDKFPEETVRQAELKEISQQKEYEAEVEVYHALERMHGIKPIIIHGFEYTAEQYSKFVHDDQPTNANGETDFVLLHQGDRVTILEVKAPNFVDERRRERIFKRNLEDSEKQRRKIMKLIWGMIGLAYPNDFTELWNIRQFTVFFSLTRDQASKISYYDQLDHDRKTEILFKDDFDDIERIQYKIGFFDKYEAQIDPWLYRSHLGLNDPMRGRTISSDLWDVHFRQPCTYLLDIWYTNQRKNPLGSYSKVIELIDKFLRRSIISRRPEGPPSSFVKGGSKVFKDHLDIDCITEDQKSVFNSEKKKLWIIGPAGTGKTILIAAKVIEMAKKPTSKIFVFAMKIHSVNRYEQHFINAGVKYRLFCNTIEETRETPLELVNLIYFRETERNPTSLLTNFVDCIKLVLSNEYHLFLDDFHVYNTLIKDSRRNFGSILGNNFSSSNENTLWITFDHYQAGLPLKTSLLDEIKPENIKCLRAVVRNTYEITKLLSSIKRSMDIASIFSETPSDGNSNTVKSQTLSQEVRHYADFRGILSRDFLLFEKKNDILLFRKKALEEQWTGIDELSDEKNADGDSIAGNSQSLTQELGHYVHGFTPNLHLTFSDNFNSFRNKEFEDHWTKNLDELSVCERAFVFLQKRPSIPHNKEQDFSPTDFNIPKALLKTDSIPSQFQEQSSLEASAHFYEDTFSLEWPAVFLILDLSSVRELEYCTKLFEVLSSLYIGASRARCVLSIIINLPSYLTTCEDIMIKLYDTFGMKHSGDSSYHLEEFQKYPKCIHNIFRLLKVFAGHVKTSMWENNYDIEIEQKQKKEPGDESMVMKWGESARLGCALTSKTSI